MTGQQLKNSILQMAVQGKLVPQNPNDEPASVLLERIRKEKEQLIKEGKIKREKNLSYIFRGADNLPYEKVGKNEPVCIADEVPFEIPDSWVWARLGMISSYSHTKQKINAQNANLDMWGLDLEDIEKGGRLLARKTVGERKAVGDKTFFDSGDILYSKLRPYLLKILVAPDCGICTPEIVPFKVFGKLNPEYIVAFLKCPYVNAIINAVTYGVKMPRVGTETMADLLVPIPPLSEQKRIVEKLNEVTPLTDSYAEVYVRVAGLNQEFPELLKKSILQEAVQGKLVPQDPADEPASVLLKRIRSEKEQLIKAGKIKRDKHESVIFRRDNSHYEKRGSEEVCIDEYLPFELPNNWQWERLINLYNFIDYRGSTPTKIDTGVPLITAKNVKKGYIDYKIRDYISEEEYCTRQSRGISQRGDILFTTEAPLGNVALADLDQFSAGQRLITLQQYTTYPLINNNLVMYFMLSDCFQSQLIEQSTGTTVKGIKADKLKQLWIPVPPLQEQVRILAQLRKVLEACIAL
ncbi:restriction endonuclease subunit S [Akkermansia muciniphila]|jgi:restriction endonuclease S subunit|uniref:restriction endonuclease subunit S n=2 Tax=Pseudomonadati TaxID=3379134 RepID=UPI000C9C78AD|nr:restriction endonuclease subunit S [Akkermansia muciniphila]PND01999.1 restriction endonuclease subunit S [Akkermansia muciniphila]QWP65341.1 restriction endonuclease subunit S [Akkermansia muciniphila]